MNKSLDASADSLFLNLFSAVRLNVIAASGIEESLTVRRQGDRLFAQDPGNPEVELFPISEDSFIVKAFDARLTFVKDDRGKVTGVIESSGGKDLKLRKIK